VRAGSVKMNIRQTISVKIKGIPYSQNKNRGQIEKPNEWSRAIESQTQDLPRVKGPCILRVAFLLPENKFPLDHPYGSDLDNLVKRLCDALQETVLSESPGKDGAIVSLEATKVRVTDENEAGANVEIIEFIS
jgi:Holliday junction resolvase RusA-like endonuclease